MVLDVDNVAVVAAFVVFALVVVVVVVVARKRHFLDEDRLIYS